MFRVFVLLTAVCAIAHGAQIRKSVLDDGHRIVGGHNADIREVPYQLSVETYGWSICGATIISEYWALTSVHCVNSVNSFTIRAGSNIPLEGGHVHNVTDIVIHPNYKNSGEDYDYALIKVEKPFPLGEDGVNSIRMSETEPKAGQIAVASGWGSLSSGGPAPSQLQKVEVPIISRRTCRKMYEDSEDYISDITERMVCAGLRNGGKDSCETDSGGPLTVDGLLVGVVSWGIGCAYPNRPRIYSNIANQRPWIRQVTGV